MWRTPSPHPLLLLLLLALAGAAPAGAGPLGSCFCELAVQAGPGGRELNATASLACSLPAGWWCECPRPRWAGRQVAGPEAVLRVACPANGTTSGAGAEWAGGATSTPALWASHFGPENRGEAESPCGPSPGPPGSRARRRLSWAWSDSHMVFTSLAYACEPGPAPPAPKRAPPPAEPPPRVSARARLDTAASARQCGPAWAADPARVECVDSGDGETCAPGTCRCPHAWPEGGVPCALAEYRGPAPRPEALCGHSALGAEVVCAGARAAPACRLASECRCPEGARPWPGPDGAPCAGRAHPCTAAEWDGACGPEAVACERVASALAGAPLRNGTDPPGDWTWCQGRHPDVPLRRVEGAEAQTHCGRGALAVQLDGLGQALRRSCECSGAHVHDPHHPACPALLPMWTHPCPAHQHAAAACQAPLAECRGLVLAGGHTRVAASTCRAPAPKRAAPVVLAGDRDCTQLERRDWCGWVPSTCRAFANDTLARCSCQRVAGPGGIGLEPLAPELDAGRPCTYAQGHYAACTPYQTQQLCGSYTGTEPVGTDNTVDAARPFRRSVCSNLPFRSFPEAYPAFLRQREILCPRYIQTETSFNTLIRTCSPEEAAIMCPGVREPACYFAGCYLIGDRPAGCRLWGQCPVERPCSAAEVQLCPNAEYATGCSFRTFQTPDGPVSGFRDCTYNCSAPNLPVEGPKCDVARYRECDETETLDLCGPVANSTLGCMRAGDRPTNCTCAEGFGPPLLRVAVETRVTNGDIMVTTFGKVTSVGLCAGREAECDNATVLELLGPHGVSCRAFCLDLDQTNEETGTSPEGRLCRLVPGSHVCLPGAREEPGAGDGNPNGVRRPCGVAFQDFADSTDPLVLALCAPALTPYAVARAGGRLYFNATTGAPRYASGVACECSPGWHRGPRFQCETRYFSRECNEVESADWRLHGNGGCNATQDAAAGCRVLCHSGPAVMDPLDGGAPVNVTGPELCFAFERPVACDDDPGVVETTPEVARRYCGPYAASARGRCVSNTVLVSRTENSTLNLSDAARVIGPQLRQTCDAASIQCSCQTTWANYYADAQGRKCGRGYVVRPCESEAEARQLCGFYARACTKRCTRSSPTLGTAAETVADQSELTCGRPHTCECGGPVPPSSLLVNTSLPEYRGSAQGTYTSCGADLPSARCLTGLGLTEGNATDPPCGPLVAAEHIGVDGRRICVCRPGAAPWVVDNVTVSQCGAYLRPCEDFEVRANCQGDAFECTLRCDPQRYAHCQRHGDCRPRKPMPSDGSRVRICASQMIANGTDACMLDCSAGAKKSCEALVAQRLPTAARCIRRGDSPNLQALLRFNSTTVLNWEYCRIPDTAVCRKSGLNNIYTGRECFELDVSATGERNCTADETKTHCGNPDQVDGCRMKFWETFAAHVVNSCVCKPWPLAITRRGSQSGGVTGTVLPRCVPISGVVVPVTTGCLDVCGKHASACQLRILPAAVWSTVLATPLFPGDPISRRYVRFPISGQFPDGAGDNRTQNSTDRHGRVTEGGVVCLDCDEADVQGNTRGRRRVETESVPADTGGWPGDHAQRSGWFAGWGVPPAAAEGDYGKDLWSNGLVMGADFDETLRLMRAAATGDPFGLLATVNGTAPRKTTMFRALDERLHWAEMAMPECECETHLTSSHGSLRRDYTATLSRRGGIFQNFTSQCTVFDTARARANFMNHGVCPLGLNGMCCGGTTRFEAGFEGDQSAPWLPNVFPMSPRKAREMFNSTGQFYGEMDTGAMFYGGGGGLRDRSDMLPALPGYKGPGTIGPRLDSQSFRTIPSPRIRCHFFPHGLSADLQDEFENEINSIPDAATDCELGYGVVVTVAGLESEWGTCSAPAVQSFYSCENWRFKTYYEFLGLSRIPVPSTPSKPNPRWVCDKRVKGSLSMIRPWHFRSDYLLRSEYASQQEGYWSSGDELNWRKVFAQRELTENMSPPLNPGGTRFDNLWAVVQPEYASRFAYLQDAWYHDKPTLWYRGYKLGTADDPHYGACPTGMEGRRREGVVTLKCRLLRRGGQAAGSVNKFGTISADTKQPGLFLGCAPHAPTRFEVRRDTPHQHRFTCNRMIFRAVMYRDPLAQSLLGAGCIHQDGSACPYSQIPVDPRSHKWGIHSLPWWDPHNGVRELPRSHCAHLDTPWYRNGHLPSFVDTWNPKEAYYLFQDVGQRYAFRPFSMTTTCRDSRFPDGQCPLDGMDASDCTRRAANTEFHPFFEGLCAESQYASSRPAAVSPSSCCMHTGFKPRTCNIPQSWDGRIGCIHGSFSHVNKTCICDEGWTIPATSEYGVPDVDRGRCIHHATCMPRYDIDEFTGTIDSLRVRTRTSRLCSGRGYCDGTACACFEGWAGTHCDVEAPWACPPNLAQNASDVAFFRRTALRFIGNSTVESQNWGRDGRNSSLEEVLPCGGRGVPKAQPNGTCACQCYAGDYGRWTGADCRLLEFTDPGDGAACAANGGQLAVHVGEEGQPVRLGSNAQNYLFMPLAAYCRCPLATGSGRHSLRTGRNCEQVMCPLGDNLEPCSGRGTCTLHAGGAGEAEQAELALYPQPVCQQYGTPASVCDPGDELCLGVAAARPVGSIPRLCGNSTRYTGCACELDRFQDCVAPVLRSQRMPPTCSYQDTGSTLAENTAVQRTIDTERRCKPYRREGLVEFSCQCPFPAENNALCSADICRGRHEALGVFDVPALRPTDETCNGGRGILGATNCTCECATTVIASAPLRAGAFCQFDVTLACGVFDALRGERYLCNRDRDARCQCSGVETDDLCTGEWKCVGCSGGRTGDQCQVAPCTLECGTRGECKFAANGNMECACDHDDVWGNLGNRPNRACDRDVCATLGAVPSADGASCECADPTLTVESKCRFGACPRAAGAVCGTAYVNAELDPLTKPSRDAGCTNRSECSTSSRTCAAGVCSCRGPYATNNVTRVCVPRCDAVHTVGYDLLDETGFPCVCEPGYSRAERCAAPLCQAGVDARAVELNVVRVEVDTRGAPVCSCPSPFVPNCTSHVCQYGGVPTGSGLGLGCACVQGFSGVFCEIFSPAVANGTEPPAPPAPATPPAPAPAVPEPVPYTPPVAPVVNDPPAFCYNGGALPAAGSATTFCNCVGSFFGPDCRWNYCGFGGPTRLCGKSARSCECLCNLDSDWTNNPAEGGNCTLPTCGEGAARVGGQCVCQEGFAPDDGGRCRQVCPPNAVFDVDAEACRCKSPWSGSRCQLNAMRGALNLTVALSPDTITNSETPSAPLRLAPPTTILPPLGPAVSVPEPELCASVLCAKSEVPPRSVVTPPSGVAFGRYSSGNLAASGALPDRPGSVSGPANLATRLGAVGWTAIGIVGAAAVVAGFWASRSGPPRRR